MKFFEINQDNWESWREILENLRGSLEKIELWVDESDNFVTIPKPTVHLSEDDNALIIRYRKKNVTEKDQTLIQKNIEEKVFGYSYILSIVNPDCLHIHLGMLKSVTMEQEQEVA